MSGVASIAAQAAAAVATAAVLAEEESERKDDVLREKYGLPDDSYIPSENITVWNIELEHKQLSIALGHYQPIAFSTSSYTLTTQECSHFQNVAYEFLPFHMGSIYCILIFPFIGVGYLNV